MSVSQQEWKKEQERVDMVVTEIKRRIQAFSQHAGKMKKDIIDIRKHFWDDVSINFEDVTETAETAASMKQQAEVLAERERSHHLAEKQLHTLIRLKDSPYFGRIDLREEGDVAIDSIYLGIASLMDQPEENFLIYDWRAPISSLFYDYSPGDVNYETPDGTVHGEMQLKRQFIIRNGKINGLFDTGTTIGDELLQEVLGQQVDSQMKSIVSTIQKEQNLLIRNEKKRLLIVQGAAGSGKTSAALQRVAYLLYRYRETLTAKQIMLFSPNPLFNSYISTVLPELGEENMVQATFQQYLEKRLGTQFQLEDSFTQLENLLTEQNHAQYDIRVKAISYKSSYSFMSLIDHYVDRLALTGLFFHDLTFRKKVLISKEELVKQFYAHESTRSIPSRLQGLMEWILQEIEQQTTKEIKEPWVEEAIEDLPEEMYIRIHKKLQKEHRYSEDTFDDFSRERQMLSEYVMRKKTKKLRQKVKQLRFVNVQGMYRQLFYEKQETNLRLPKEWLLIAQQTIDQMNRHQLLYEDATPFLYFQERLLGMQSNTFIRHLFIDEAQDYSPFQLAFLKRLFPRSKMTVLGDMNQAIYAHSQHQDNSFSVLTDGFEPKQCETIHFTRAYRSTQPIIEFTRQMVPGGEQIIPFERAGNLPTVTYVSDQKEQEEKIVKKIQSLVSSDHQTIAIICKTAQESKKVAQILQTYLPVRLIKKETSAFEQSVLVIPSYLAKGVEFDAVIIYDASETVYRRENERKLFYTACTRAKHELHLYYNGKISPFVADVSRDSYKQM